MLTKQRRGLAIAFLLLLGPAHTAVAATPRDSCAPLIPESLRAAVGREFKGYRLPRESDSLPEDVTYAREHGSHGFLGFASADFDGDGVKDVALILSSTPPRDLKVVGALAHGKGWRFETVETFEGEPVRWFVERAKPGRYVETQAWDYGTEDPRAKESFESSTDGLWIGRTESASRVYFRVDAQWVYVQVSD